MPQQSPTNQYKYREDHEKLPCECPVEKDLSYYEAIAFRFVHKNTTHPNCSLPNLKINPKRKISDCSRMCGGYALSFYVSLEHAKEGYKYCASHFHNFKDTVGKHIAECQLTASDGRCEKTDKQGHFNFHEFEGTDLTNRFYNVVDAEP